jgi:hypothetical protein
MTTKRRPSTQHEPTLTNLDEDKMIIRALPYGNLFAASLQPPHH